MKTYLLLLSLAMFYTATQTSIKIKTAIIYQGTAIDYFDLKRPRIA